jgi:predicted DNA-binding ribbon-helix-helix protein
MKPVRGFSLTGEAACLTNTSPWRPYVNSLEGVMKSLVTKRSIVVGGHKTSVSLEEAFWKGLKEIASNRNVTLSELVSSIDCERLHGNLSSAIRLFILEHYRTMINSATAVRSADLGIAPTLSSTP